MIPAETQALLHRMLFHASSDYSAERDEAIKHYKFEIANRHLWQSSIHLQGATKIYREYFAKFVRTVWEKIEKTLEAIGFEPDKNAAADLYSLMKTALTPIMERDNKTFSKSFAGTFSPHPQLHANRNAELFRLETQVAIFVKKLHAMNTNPKAQGGNQTINYYLQGNNPRVNINSHDESHNVVVSEGQLFAKLHEAISSAEVESDLKKRLLEKIEEGKTLQQKPGLLKGWFADFMALASDCITVVQPFVPALAALIAKH